MNVFTEWLNQYFDELEAEEFYRMIFPAGELDLEGAKTPGKYTGIILQVTKDKKKDGRPKVKRFNLYDDLAAVREAMETENFCIVSPLSYAGKERTAANARMMYAITVDLDKIRTDGENGERPIGLMNLWNGHITRAERIPKPTAIVSSGTGIHLYYILKKPIPLFRNIVEQLQAFKQKLTWLIWNESIVDIKDDRDIQQEGIFQAFRMVGTVTKNGSRARAFLTGEKVSMEYLNEFVDEKSRVTQFSYKSDLTKAQAKEKYPEWYERRIERGEPKGVWHVNRALYDWWKRKIREGARVGHRYNCLMVLVTYAMKCSMYDEKHNPHPVTYEELEKDCFDFLDYMESLTDDENNHFTEGDVLDALQLYKNSYINYPRAAVEYRSGISVPANKRNRIKQKQHLYLARRRKEDMKVIGLAFKNPEGRPRGSGTKEDIVREWIANHPYGTKAACIRETGLSKPTVYKYWSDVRKTDNRRE